MLVLLARVLFFIEGLSIFLLHPVFGVGYNNARYHNSISMTYTHSLYSELPACTGLIGTALFCYALVRPWFLIQKERNRIKTEDSLLNTKLKYVLAIFVVFLAANLAQIAFYSYNLMYVFAVVCGISASLPPIRKRQEAFQGENM